MKVSVYPKSDGATRVFEKVDRVEFHPSIFFYAEEGATKAQHIAWINEDEALCVRIEPDDENS